MVFWGALSIDFEAIWSQISCSGSQICSRIELRIINFVTWVSGRPPGGPQGVLRGRPSGTSPLFRGRVWSHFWYQNLLISESIFGLEKSEVRERIFMDFGLVWEGQPYKNQLKNNWFLMIFHFWTFRLPRELLAWKCVKMISKWAPKPLQNEVRNEVWNRGGFEMPLRIDFLGFM